MLIAAWAVRGDLRIIGVGEKPPPVKDACKEIVGTVGEGETFFDIFKKWHLDTKDLFKLREASAGIHRLREVQPGQPYKMLIDDSGIRSLNYWIDDDTILSVNREQDNFSAARLAVDYERRIQKVGGVITDNLVVSMGQGRDNLMLALQLSDIFAWDIDFTTDLRKGDVFNVVVEGLYLQGKFRKYGNILSAEIVNNGEELRAYRFEQGGESDYYDAGGRTLRKAFLKAPLNFRRISSNFSSGRFHPILKIYRPHHGLDYAAPAGTPVSAVGEGTVLFAGAKGQYGNLVTIKHSNGWKTYYGHLSKIERGVRKGAKVGQGMMIGRVGSTGLASGPHLHYEVRIKGKPVNPVALRVPRTGSLPKKVMAEFERSRDNLDIHLSSITPPGLTLAGKNGR